MSPVLNCPPVAVRVCVAVSLLVTLTVPPGATVSDIGLNMKLEMVMEVPLLEAPDVDDVPLFVPGLLLPQAARSRAPARTRTPAPTFNRIRISLRRRCGRAEGDRGTRGGLGSGVHPHHVVEDGDVLHLDRLNGGGKPDCRRALQHGGLGLIR